MVVSCGTAWYLDLQLQCCCMVPHLSILRLAVSVFVVYILSAV